jgi:hypothetical protein
MPRNLIGYRPYMRYMSTETANKKREKKKKADSGGQGTNHKRPLRLVLPLGKPSAIKQNHNREKEKHRNQKQN